jgi:molybdopterin converting factor small subunit
MARLRLFGPAREAAGQSCVTVGGPDVGGAIEEARVRFGARFADIVAVSSIWLNGEEAAFDESVGPDDEVAVIPPVSGG